MLFYRLASPKTTGCLIANNQGLCIESNLLCFCFCSLLTFYYYLFFILEKGEISANASGLLVAILEHAGKLEPNSNPPIVSLESDKT